MATEVKRSRDGHVQFVVLAALLAVLNVLWAVIASPRPWQRLPLAFSLRVGLCIANGASRSRRRL